MAEPGIKGLYFEGGKIWGGVTDDCEWLIAERASNLPDEVWEKFIEQLGCLKQKEGNQDG